MNNLRFFRERIGLTQSELAELAGCTPGAIGHYETGRRGMDINLCRHFVAILNTKGASAGLDDVFPPRTQTAA
ncbi:helix-turn-helix transcriptional regulator [Yersinia ruckeri]|uniref:helix-turn-helix transcriptional regulator n=1 Tax=Yersinia ruckeri TaxID=29486 RepID=UPI0020BD5C6F|nr:helix-turn-helix transcriptional regulator [Yersinia ruckeri]MCK8571319.1 helix-turn-helix domain-containing protein [Yersinia ruckeri]MCK8577678.1 helix-turn-helix domain-containing protein [Yersinia ruckeri]MCK8581447.1 helix-turn-helix domain-containing protein [Yersinia ruckeri]MCW6569783.1 helix-turn-helix domain-containing protein [Yersinia ruckeri]UZX52892.1 helix-turn-helix domain-containing protein [Yersinia ruckeri]